MDRTASRIGLALAAAALLPFTTGCHPGLLAASAVYMWEGGNLAPAEFEALEDKRVVVFCRAPVAQEFRHAAAPRNLAKRISSLLRDNVPGVDIVPQRKVDEWIDENDSDAFEQLGHAVKADYVVQVELGHFDLFKGPTVYQGSADVTINVYDMNDGDKLVWDKSMGEVLFPVHGSVPVQDKPISQFQNEYLMVLSEQIAQHFYRYDPTNHFAIDALANR